MDSADSLSNKKSKKKERGALFVAAGFFIVAILISVVLYSSAHNPGIPPIASYTLQQSSTTTNYTLTITSMSQGYFKPAGIQDAYLIAILPGGTNVTVIPFENISEVWYNGAMFKDNDSNNGLTVGDALCLKKDWLFNTGTIIQIIVYNELIGNITLA
jgi:hypothetical protein